MHGIKRGTAAAALQLFSLCTSLASASSLPSHIEKLIRKQAPAEPTGVKTIKSPGGVTIRYKEPELEGVCETTPGVNSYSGYVDLDENTHMFFWFFEARNNPDEAPLTLWLNGGPGSDSLIGLFEGVGFSYADAVVGVINQTTGLPVNSSQPDGRYSDVDPYRFDTTDLAAKGTWEVLQAFIKELPVLDETVKSRSFNLWTESYGGHYGPAFFKYFYDQNKLIQDGNIPGVELSMHTLGIINGIISERIQAPYYAEMAFRNTYGIEAVNQTIYDYMKMNYYFPGGCRDSIDQCFQQDRSTPDGKAVVASGRNPYDIRARDDANIPPGYWVNYLNQAKVQNAIGVDINYTSTSSSQIYTGFDYTGDFVYPNLLEDLEALLAYDVRIAMIYGDAVRLLVIFSYLPMHRFPLGISS
ncbi:hypothetical protein Daesc_007143 [Daldinia eschscholtzii]|uniref:Carboxypeptidase n=1 Tax=Daldinia eschscholtzii TaxID=292717 RepID=A0AAX6MD96_9PEZI